MSRSRLLLCSCYGGMFGIAASVNVLPTCLSSISRTFELDHSQQGLLIGCIFWGYIIALFFAAPLTDKFGPRRFFYVAAVAQALGFALAATASNVIWLAAAITLAGIGGGILETMLTPVIVSLYPEKKTAANNMLHGFYAIGAVAVVMVAWYILGSFDNRDLTSGIETQNTVPTDNSLGWRLSFAAMLPIPLLYGLGFLICFRFRGLPISYPHSESFFGTAKRLWRWSFALFLFGLLCVGGSEISAAQWIPTYLETELNWTPETSAWGLLVFSLFMGFGRLASGPIADRVTPGGMLIMAGIISAICFLAMGTSQSGIFVLTQIAILGIFAGWMWPTSMVVVSEHFPSTGATMFALLAIAGNAGGILFPGLVGFVAKTADLRTAITSMAVVPLFVTLIFLLWWLWQKRCPAPQQTP